MFCIVCHLVSAQEPSLALAVQASSLYPVWRWLTVHEHIPSPDALFLNVDGLQAQHSDFDFTFAYERNLPINLKSPFVLVCDEVHLRHSVLHIRAWIEGCKSMQIAAHPRASHSIEIPAVSFLLRKGAVLDSITVRTIRNAPYSSLASPTCFS